MVSNHRKWDDDVKKMNDAIGKEGIEGIIMEVYSRPRVDAVARMWGLLPGWSLDLTTLDPEHNMPWDFTK